MNMQSERRYQIRHGRTSAELQSYGKRLILVIAFVFALAVIACLTSCSASRKTVKEDTQTHVNANVQTEVHQQTQRNDNAAVSVEEQQLTNAVITFTKVEYDNGAVELTADTTNDSAHKSPTTQQRNRESRKPPNYSGNVKSVTSGSITFDNMKQSQTSATYESIEVTQAKSMQNQNLTEGATTQKQTTEKAKHGFFWYFGIMCAVLFCIAILWLVCHAACVIRKASQFEKDYYNDKIS